MIDPVETLQRLIQTPSVNPMGHDVSGSMYGESRMTESLIAICEAHRWPWIRQPVDADRDNLLAIIQGSPTPDEGGELLLWDVHQDTVSIEGMTVAPFGGELRDGRVYGRGASDVKGSMAAMLAALSKLSELSHSASPRPTIVLACTANEECGFTGARKVAEMWSSGKRPDDNAQSNLITGPMANWLVRRPDAVIVAEPTEFNVIVAHNGVVRWRCHTIGKAAHTSRPELGINAIYGMMSIVQAIQQFHDELTAKGVAHPLCGRPTATVSTICGGVGVNTVPEHVTIEIDRRLAPNEMPMQAYEELIHYIAEHADTGQCRVEHDPPFMHSHGLSEQGNAHTARRIIDLVHARGRDASVIGAPYGTDGAAFSAEGVPTVVVGPGSIEQAHKADEFIEIEELRFGVDLFYEIACRGLR